jgi:hypothetical protein
MVYVAIIQPKVDRSERAGEYMLWHPKRHHSILCGSVLRDVPAFCWVCRLFM